MARCKLLREEDDLVAALRCCQAAGTVRVPGVVRETESEWTNLCVLRSTNDEKSRSFDLMHVWQIAHACADLVGVGEMQRFNPPMTVNDLFARADLIERVQ